MTVRVTVTLDDAADARIDEVADALRDRGMTVDQVLGPVGVITGSAEDPDRLRDVAGVAAVEEAAAFRIAPPDADVQ